jgi:hypothetical protein
LDQLNYKLGKLEQEAKAAGVVLGETAEKEKAQKEQAKLQVEQERAREEAKQKEAENDSASYEKIRKEVTNSNNSLETLLKFNNEEENNLYTGHFVHATNNLVLIEKIRLEGNTDILRAYRHMARKFNNQAKSSKEINALENIINVVDLSLSKQVVPSDNTVVSPFQETTENKNAYQQFKYILKMCSNELKTAYNKFTTSDLLFKLLVARNENELSSIKIPEKDFNSLFYPKYTSLQLEAFSYALSMVGFSMSPKKMSELKENIVKAIQQSKKNEADHSLTNAVKKFFEEEQKILQNSPQFQSSSETRKETQTPLMKPRENITNSPKANPAGKATRGGPAGKLKDDSRLISVTAPKVVKTVPEVAPWVVKNLDINSDGGKVEKSLKEVHVPGLVANEAGHAVMDPVNNTDAKKMRAVTNIIIKRGVELNALKALKYGKVVKDNIPSKY